MWKINDEPFEWEDDEIKSILLNQGRFVMTEKTIELRKLWDGEIMNAINEPNSKLWKMIAIAQEIKKDAVKNQSYELAAYCREVERNGALIILKRIRENIMNE